MFWGVGFVSVLCFFVCFVVVVLGGGGIGFFFFLHQMCTLLVFLRHADSLAADAADSSALSSRNLIWARCTCSRGLYVLWLLG